MLRSLKYGLYGAVVAGLVAAPVVWTAVDKSVHLVVDGHSTTVSTTAGSVGAVLADHKLAVRSHDLLAPTKSARVADGMHIVLRRGRLLHLAIDGRATQVWTTAPTVNDALAQLGYTTSDFVSVSRSQRLPLGPTSIAIRTPQAVTVVHDGTRQQVVTTDATVGQLLTRIGVVPGALDRLSVPTSTPIAAGEVITLQRVGKKLVTRVEVLKYSTSNRNDAKLAKGVTKVATTGRPGSASVTYSVVYVDGRAIGQTRVRAVTLAAPRTKIIDVGTKRIEYLPASTSGGGSSSNGSTPNSPVPTPGSAKAIARGLLQQEGYGDKEYSCLTAMWGKESAWRVDAANGSGAYGIPQALPGSKMASAGPDWQTNAETQIKWGLGYIKNRYGTPCDAWSFWQGHNYY